MTYAFILVAILLAWLPGVVWLAKLLPFPCMGRHSLIAGYAILSGLIGVPLIMRGFSFVGIEFSFWGICLALLSLLTAGLFLPSTAIRHNTQNLRIVSAPASGWEKAVIAICLALIALRLLNLGLELGLRPMYSWDSKQHWAKLAKVLLDARSVVPYVSLQEWLNLHGENVHTTIHPDYPITIPLLQAWAGLAIGEWRDDLVNFPWLLCYLAIGLLFHGHARLAGASQAVAIAFTYMLVSLPYLNIQIALAGYADIFLAACYLAAVTAFFSWSRHKEAWAGILALVFALSCLLVKNEGFFWLLTFIPGLAVVFLGLRRSLPALLAMFLLLLALLYGMPGDLVVSGHSLDKISLQYRPESWEPIYLSIFVHDNWHLAAYLFAALTLAVIFFARSRLHDLAGIIATICSAITLYLALYLLTSNSYGAVNYTSLNRVALQLVPAVWFVALLLYLALAKTQESGQNQRDVA